MNIAPSRHVEQTGVRLLIVGEIESAASDRVATAIRSACCNGVPPSMIVDIDRVTVLHAAGIATLVEA